MSLSLSSQISGMMSEDGTDWVNVLGVSDLAPSEVARLVKRARTNFTNAMTESVTTGNQIVVDSFPTINDGSIRYVRLVFNPNGEVIVTNLIGDETLGIYKSNDNQRKSLEG